jgi:uncharacterized membrane protein YfcA
LYFPVSGVEANPFILLMAAFVIALVTAPAGISGAFLLLPFQVSVLGFAGPAVSPTNLIYNVVAIPGGVWSYVKERRMVWPLTWVIALGTLPGVFIGAVLRVTYLSDPRAFKAFVGLVLLYLGSRQLYTAVAHLIEGRRALARHGSGRQQEIGTYNEPLVGVSRTLHRGDTVRPGAFSLKKIEYEFGGRSISFATVPVLLLSLGVGVVGGIYGIGGGSIMAPFLVTVLGLPVYTVAGAALMGTLLTSVAGVACFQALAATGIGVQSMVAPDWSLGLILGAGGLVGSYVGARTQKFLPETFIKLVLGALITLLSLGYLADSSDITLAGIRAWEWTYP